MSNDREIDALKRRLGRHIQWGAAARAHARDMLDPAPLVRSAAEGWWRQTLDEPRVVASEGSRSESILPGSSSAATEPKSPEPHHPRAGREVEDPMTAELARRRVSYYVEHGPEALGLPEVARLLMAASVLSRLSPRGSE